MNKRIIGYFLNTHEQGLFPPNDYITDIIEEDWLKALKKQFNNILFTYYFDRTIFYDVDKYPIESEITTYNNLRKTISYVLLSKAKSYENLYDVMMAKYNPLWNVDGTESTTRTLEQTGTDVNSKSGSDTISNSGNDVTSGQKTTYDTSFLDTDKSTLTHGLESETEYNSSNTNTRNLLDTERITVERHGNIGVTKSSELLSDSEKLYMEMDILKFITHDIVNQITYGIY